MKFFIATTMFLAAFTSQAARVQFDFDVYSSGASIYPCNAGIKHKKHQGVFCYNPNTGDSCNPNGGSQNGPSNGPGNPGGGFGFPGGGATGGQFPGNGGFPGQGNGPGFLADIGLQETPPPSNNCDPQTGEGCDCVCAGDLDGRYENTLDTARGEFTKWRDHGDDQSNFSITIEKNAGSQDFHKLIDSDDQFGKRLKSLSFNLGSELYGSKYFVDICYRATQIDYGQDADYNLVEASNTDNLKFVLPEEIADEDGIVMLPESINHPIYKFERKITVTDLAGSNTSNDWDLDEDDIIWSEESYQSASRLSVRSKIYCKDKNDNYVSIYGGSGNPTASIDLSATSVLEFYDRYAHADLKGCIVRYEFEEKARYANEVTDKFRRWKMQAANVCTDTAITNVQGHDHDYDF